MTVHRMFVAILALQLHLLIAAVALGAAEQANDVLNDQPSAKVYGQWRILVKPDKGHEYNELIASRGLPLFREAGGRMVGWWNTLIGNLYEHVTIWEYDDMASFERAVKFLGSEERFAQFVALRDPLLAGEESRFLRLANHAEPPVLSDPSEFVIHEIHRVPLRLKREYLKFMSQSGLELLQKHGFRPVGPWTVEVGDWTEVTYLFRFDSLAERDQLRAQFSAHRDGEEFGKAIDKYVDEITTRLLVPAAFTRPAAQKSAGRSLRSSLLVHVEELTPGVFAAGFADRYRSANCGWVTFGQGTLLIDVPRGIGAAEFLAEVERLSGKPVQKLALTNLQPGDEQMLAAIRGRGVDQIVTSPAIQAALTRLWKDSATTGMTAFAEPRSFDCDELKVQIIPVDGVVAGGGIAVHLPQKGVLFAGPLVVNGPRTPLTGSDTQLWVAALQQLDRLNASHVVPGFGTWGGPQIVRRQQRLLDEVRTQVAYVVAQGRPASVLNEQVRIPANLLVWMPYDTPTKEDLEHVYRELTVPNAPFNGREPAADDPRPHALVLIGDQPHEPGHIVEGLAPVFAATGVVAHFTVDVRALTAQNLAKVDLLVILRDGLQRPSDDPSTHYVWMTPEQQQVIDRYVKEGGAFLNLHNSMGLYPEQGPYLQLVGGRYIGHGPLERFRVEVVDADHPIVQGVDGFSVADEEHTPPYDAAKVRLLLRNRSDDGTVVAAAGWAYEPGKGRLCHLANGHTRESLLHPMYQRLMQNAVNWCLRRTK